MRDTLHTTVVLDALDMAAAQRHASHVIYHADQGSQYPAFAFAQRCQTLGVRRSMGSRGDTYDNAMAESFFSTLECECLAKHRFHLAHRSPAHLVPVHRRLVQHPSPTLRARAAPH